MYFYKIRRLAMGKILVFVFIIFGFFGAKSQVNADFREVKEKFQRHRTMLETEFNKKQNQLTKSGMKELVNQHKEYFLKKLDSVENAALVATLVKVKNLEDLSRTFPRNSDASKIDDSKDETLAKYPGGIDAIRNFISAHLYTDSVNFEEQEKLSTKVKFIVERDGSVSQVKASGSSASLNRQGEIVLYLLPEKFSPAAINGVPVRSIYSIPITIAKN